MTIIILKQNYNCIFYFLNYVNLKIGVNNRAICVHKKLNNI